MIHVLWRHKVDLAGSDANKRRPYAIVVIGFFFNWSQLGANYFFVRGRLKK